MNKSTITILVLTTVIILLIFELAVPFYSQVNAAQLELKQTIIKEREAQAMVDRARDLAKDYETMKDEIDKVNIFLPDDEDQASVIIGLEEIASESGIFLESISFAPQSSPLVAAGGGDIALWKDLSLQISASGSYSSFKNFIKAVEKNMRLMDVRAARVNSQENDKQFKLSVDLDAHYLSK